MNLGAWVNLGSPVTLSASGGNYNVSHDDNTLVNSNNIRYRAVVVDAIQSTTSSIITINFLHRNFLGYSTNTVLTLTQILDLPNSILSNSKVREVYPMFQQVLINILIMYIQQVQEI